MPKTSAMVSLTMIVLFMDYSATHRKSHGQSSGFFSLGTPHILCWRVGSTKAGAVLCITGRLEASATPTHQLPLSYPLTVTTRNIWRYCQMSPGGQNCHLGENHQLRMEGRKEKRKGGRGKGERKGRGEKVFILGILKQLMKLYKMKLNF